MLMESSLPSAGADRSRLNPSPRPLGLHRLGRSASFSISSMPPHGTTSAGCSVAQPSIRRSLPPSSIFQIIPSLPCFEGVEAPPRSPRAARNPNLNSPRQHRGLSASLGRALRWNRVPATYSRLPANVQCPSRSSYLSNPSCTQCC